MNKLEHGLHPKRLHIKVTMIAGRLVEASRPVSHGRELTILAILDNECGHTKHILHLVLSLGSEALHEAVLTALTHVNEFCIDMSPVWVLKKELLRAYFPLWRLPARDDMACTKVPIGITRVKVEPDPCVEQTIIVDRAFEWQHPITTAPPLATASCAVGQCTPDPPPTSGNKDGARPRDKRSDKLGIKRKVRWTATELRPTPRET